MTGAWFVDCAWDDIGHALQKKHATSTERQDRNTVAFRRKQPSESSAPKLGKLKLSPENSEATNAGKIKRKRKRKRQGRQEEGRGGPEFIGEV